MVIDLLYGLMGFSCCGTFWRTYIVLEWIRDLSWYFCGIGCDGFYWDLFGFELWSLVGLDLLVVLGVGCVCVGLKCYGVFIWFFVVNVLVYGIVCFECVCNCFDI